MSDLQGEVQAAKVDGAVRNRTLCKPVANEPGSDASVSRKVLAVFGNGLTSGISPSVNDSEHSRLTVTADGLSRKA